MGLQFIKVGPAHEVKTDHLIGCFGGLSARPQGNQHAGDDRNIHLYFNAISILADQVSTAEDVLEEPEVNLNGPAAFVNCRNRFRRRKKTVSGTF
jgi:hypothetical protein